MMIPSACEQCDWRPLATHPAVRDEPWADIDAGFTYSYCDQCGNLTVHSYNPASGFGQVYMLDRGAMTLLRFDASPGAISAYLFSENYARNRGIADPIFRGYLRSAVDVSALTNGFVDVMERAHDIRLTTLALELFIMVLDEVRRRSELGEPALRLRLNELDPVILIARGGLSVLDHDPDRLATARYLAWQVLEAFGHPGLWDALDEERARFVEEITDHLALMELVRRGFERGLERVRGDGVLRLYVEAKFFKRVLVDRGARVNDDLAAIAWRCLQELNYGVERGDERTRRLAQRAFVRIRALLEHQLMALGLQKSGVEGTHAGLIEFVDPRSGRSVQMPPYRTRLYVYEQTNSPTPSAVLEEWDLLRRHLFR